MTRLEFICDIAASIAAKALDAAYKVHYEGKLPKGPSFIFAKHQGRLDQFLIGAMLHRQNRRPANYIMRKFKFPMHYLLQIGGGILVVRSIDVRRRHYSGQQEKEINNRAAKYAISRLELGETLAMFPEGTRAYKKLHTPFKMWIPEQILQAYGKELPCTPLGIEYEDERKRGSHIWVRAGEPFYVKNTTELEQRLLIEIPKLSGL